LRAAPAKKDPENLLRPLPTWCGSTTWSACFKCRKRFELTGQSTVLISDNLAIPTPIPKISAIADFVGSSIREPFG